MSLIGGATFVVVRQTLEKLKFSCCLYLVKTFLPYNKQFKTSKDYLIYCQSKIDFCFIFVHHHGILYSFSRCNIAHISKIRIPTWLKQVWPFQKYLYHYLNKEGNLILIESHFNLTNHTHKRNTELCWYLHSVNKVFISYF